MTHDPTETRRSLVQAATRAFADHGVWNASLLEITRTAGQRNRGAVHYHFGSRVGILVQVLGQFSGRISGRVTELMAQAGPAPSIEGIARAIVQPAVELTDEGWLARCYLIILAELIEQDPTEMDDDVRAALEELGGDRAYGPLEELISDLPEPVRAERLMLMTSFVLRSIADRGRADERTTTPRPQLATPDFTDNLIAMVIGMVTAPVFV